MRPWTRELLLRIAIVCGALLLAIVSLELAVRLLGETDADGQFEFGGYDLPPYALPLDELRAEVEAYLSKRDQATLIPDPLTGWTYKPKSTRENGNFTINGAGLRARREYALPPADDTLRIALFGDSFVAGDEVKDNEVWGYQLESLLLQAGIRTEVLNFGVGGYGMGQAFLRWQHKGKDYSPDIVIFVFQAENLSRNVNIFRILYGPGFIYTKPRFILKNGGGTELALLNSPALPPEAVMDALETFDSHPLAEYEAYYRGREFVSPIWKLSRFAGLLYAMSVANNPASTPAQLYGPTSERAALGMAIVDAFAADVAGSGAEFIVLHLPRNDHFRDFHAGKQLPWRSLLNHIQSEYHFINAEAFLGAEYTDDSYYQPHGHNGPEINSRIAEAVAADLLACIEIGTCELARFQDLRDIKTMN